MRTPLLGAPRVGASTTLAELTLRYPTWLATDDVVGLRLGLAIGAAMGNGYTLSPPLASLALGPTVLNGAAVLLMGGRF